MSESSVGGDCGGEGVSWRRRGGGGVRGLGVEFLILWCVELGRDGDGEVKASKSAWSRPRGSESGMTRLRFGVDGKGFAGVLFEPEGLVVTLVALMGSTLQADDRRRFLETRGGVCGDEVVAH